MSVCYRLLQLLPLNVRSVIRSICCAPICFHICACILQSVCDGPCHMKVIMYRDISAHPAPKHFYCISVSWGTWVHTGLRETFAEEHSRQDDLVRHKRLVHSAVKQFQCINYYAKFGRKDHLERHTKIHPAQSERLFRCDGCESSSAKIRTDVATHRDYERFQIKCSSCDLLFSL